MCGVTRSTGEEHRNGMVCARVSACLMLGVHIWMSFKGSMYHTRNLLAWGAFLSLWALSTMVAGNLTVMMQVDWLNKHAKRGDVPFDQVHGSGALLPPLAGALHLGQGAGGVVRHHAGQQGRGVRAAQGPAHELELHDAGLDLPQCCRRTRCCISWRRDSWPSCGNTTLCARSWCPKHMISLDLHVCSLYMCDPCT